MRKQQSGFTLYELLFVIAFFAIIGCVGYVLFHFIAKFW